MSRLFQCVSKICRTDENFAKPGCMIITFGQNPVNAKMYPLYEGKMKQEFKELF